MGGALLVSHLHKFIYLKTVKTAGTSVEIYLERFCWPQSSEYEESHTRQEVVSSAGIIGFRGPDKKGEQFYNHMPASEIRSKIGENIWNDYTKIACVRDPYDCAVSMFWFSIPDELRRKLLTAPFDQVRSTFREWLPRSVVTNGRIVTIKNELILDEIIRHETLQEDLENTCRRVGLPYEPERLGKYKSRRRGRSEHFSEYYDAESAAVVFTGCRFEFEVLGYERLGLAGAGRCPPIGAI